MKGYKEGKSPSKEIYRFYYPEENMILWDTYLSARTMPSELRNDIFYPFRMSISIGRNIKTNINKDLIKGLSEKHKEKLIANYKAETALQPNLSFFDTVRNFLSRTMIKVPSILGMKTSMDPANIEIFEFIKTDDPENMKPLIVCAGLCMGYLSLNKGYSLERQKKLRQEAMEIFKNMYDKGVQKARRDSIEKID